MLKEVEKEVKIQEKDEKKGATEKEKEVEIE